MAVDEVKLLVKFDFKKQVTFAYLCCKRFYPNYLYFSQNKGFGDPQLLNNAIEIIYDSIENPTIDRAQIDNLLEKISLNTPRQENFDTFYASVAMYTSGIIYESVNLLKTIDTSRILCDISTMCTDAIDLFIQERDEMEYDDEDFESKILSDALMKQEIYIQKGIVNFLNKITTISVSDIDTLLQLQKNSTLPLILH